MIDQEDAKKLAQLNFKLAEFASRYDLFFDEEETSFDESQTLEIVGLYECAKRIRLLLADLPSDLNKELSGIMGSGWRIRLSMMLEDCSALFQMAYLRQAFIEKKELQQIDFSKVQPTQNWAEVEAFLKQAQEAVWGAYILFRKGEFNQFQDATAGKIPPLNVSDGQWIRSPDLASALELQNDTLNSYRSKGTKLGDDAGTDFLGRSWRKDAKGKIWYYVNGLREDEIPKAQNWIRKQGAHPR